MSKRLIATALLGLCASQSPRLAALTTDEFFAICESAAGRCQEHPVLQAYVGGALDLLATLDEQTEYLDEVYCKHPRGLFDVAAIMEFMQAQREGYGDRNAMLLVVRYFERHGGCEPGP